MRQIGSYNIITGIVRVVSLMHLGQTIALNCTGFLQPIIEGTFMTIYADYQLHSRGN